MPPTLLFERKMYSRHLHHLHDVSVDSGREGDRETHEIFFGMHYKKQSEEKQQRVRCVRGGEQTSSAITCTCVKGRTLAT